MLLRPFHAALVAALALACSWVQAAANTHDAAPAAVLKASQTLAFTPQAGGIPASLTQLETWARTQAPAARLAQTEVAVAEQRSAFAEARQGAQLFGGAALDNTREAVTDSLSRDYRRAQLEVGVRWPLLGSRAAQQRDVREADEALTKSRIQRLQVDHEAVQSVRRAYVRHLRSNQRARIALAFLQPRSGVEDQLLRRRQSGVLLEADRLELIQLFDSVQAAYDSQDTAQQLASADLSRLAGQARLAIETREPLWPQACLAPQFVATLGDQHPAVKLAQLDVDASLLRQEQAHLEGVDASLSVAQSISRDLGGQPGHSTRVGVNFSVPLQWRALRDAALARAQRDSDRAQTLLLLRRSEFEASSQQALANYRLRSRDVTSYELRQRAAMETVRVARLRVDAFDGDGYSKLLTARYALYQAAMQTVDGAERRDLAALEVLNLGGDCALESPESAPAAPLDPLTATLTALTADTTGAASTAQTQTQTGLGWYVWQAQALLDQPERLKDIPVGSQRLLLSFTAPQLRALNQPGGLAQLQAFAAQAHALHLRIDLLLGDPGWVLPKERPQLLALIDALHDLPFDGLHLDLERSQLPTSQQRRWETYLLDTLRAVRSHTQWPVALTTHYRELRDPTFASKLHAVGVSELVAMVYVNNPERTATIVRPLLQAPSGLRLWVAQSIERALPSTESSFNAGRSASLQRWRDLMHQLAPVPGFAGIVVQSLEDYREARP